MYDYRATITRVIDGDTVDAQIDLGFTVSVSVRLRLYGIDTPELHSQDDAAKLAAVKAKALTTELLQGKTVKISTYKKPDKYGRYLADIFLEDGTFVNEKIMQEGLANPYFGGKKI